MAPCSHNRMLVLIPAYNADHFLRELIPRLRSVVPEHDLLVVDDGSTDATRQTLREQRVKHISFGRNRGKGAALKAGFEYAAAGGYRSVLTLDADLQHLPEEIPPFLNSDDGRTLIIGTRNIRLRQMPFARWLTNNLTSIIISVFSCRRVRDSQSGFRLIPVALLRSIRLKTVNYDFESELLFKAGVLGYAVGEVPVTTVYEGSHSYINPLADTLRFVRQIFKRVWV